ncbi:spore germination protein [Clostridium aestuarii]|uniref:Spore germination protein n=1 Tax=Clostridium aestuarii TaxID=338193 RepID=A0ABT4CWC4_9CLOT|nr:spore germination protein [Clostridium aestuarii]MCY6483117.1 spore germination protein [Clostridium aestuarii]
MLNNIEEKINFIFNKTGINCPINIKKFYIGKSPKLLACIIYIENLSDKDIINRDILTHLMFKIDEEIIIDKTTAEYICRKYIPMSSTIVKDDLNAAVDAIKVGKAVILIDGLKEFIISDTVGGEHRNISDSLNESAIRGSREGFVENIQTNISILRRKIKDKNLSMETYEIGRRSQTDLVIMYIDDIVDKDILCEVRRRLKAIDIDSINDTGMLEQYIEDHPYSPFPQVFGTERPDIVKANLMEGKIAILLNGTPHVITVPALFIEFFQAVEDYHERTLVSSFSRILRTLATFIIIIIAPTYLTLISYNVELIPVKFITPIIESRKGIALSPILEILSMELVVEFLREGGLRLPPKIAGTLSIVGGIIIGNTAVESKVVSPSTLLIVGIGVISTFLIPNYEMSLSIRFIRFPMIFLANAMGFLGIISGLFFLLIILSSMKSFGVSYFSINSSDLKDIFIRAPLWYMNKTPKSVPNNNPIRQTNFRKKLWRKNNKNE